MSDSYSLRPSRVVAVLPFAVGAKDVTGRQADLCRGLAVFLERRLGRLPGVQPLLQNLFISAETDPGKKGWLMTNQMWSLEQALSLPIAREGSATHLLHGQVKWEGDSIGIEMELLDLEHGIPKMREEQSGHSSQLIQNFLRIVKVMATALMDSRSCGRVMSRVPTRDVEAFELFILGLAASQALGQRMVSAAVPLRLLADALEKDSELLEAAQELEAIASAHMDSDLETIRTLLPALSRARQACRWHHGFMALEGLIQARLGQEPEAVELLEQYLVAEPKGERAVSALLELTRLHRGRNDLSKIRKLLQAAVSADPEDATAWEALAEAHVQIGEVIRAEHCWRRALQVDPDRQRALISLGEAYLRRGDHRHATPLLDRAHQQDLGDTRVVGLLVESLIGAEEFERADELATMWVEEHPESLAAWLNLATVRRKRKDYPAANHCIAKAREAAVSPSEQAEVALADFANRQPLEFAELQRVIRLTTPSPDQARALAWKFSTGVYAREQVPLLWRETARLHAIAGDYRPAAACLALAMNALQESTDQTLLQLADWQIRGGLLEEAEGTLGRASTGAKARVETLHRALEEARRPAVPSPPSNTPKEISVTSKESSPAEGILQRLWRGLRSLLNR